MIFHLPGLIINIRKPEIEDVTLIARWLSDRAYLDNFGGSLGNNASYYKAQAEKILQDNANDFSGNLYFIAEDRFNKKPLALTMLCKIDWKNRHAEYAYLIGEDSHRSKIVSGDLNVVLYNYFFNGLNFNKIYGFVVSSNIASQRINAFGGKCDGTLRMHQFRGSATATDVHVYSITQTEFKYFVNKHANTLLRKHIARGLIKWTPEI
jgi:RimJ/RimL family protein N-acetyltransferase